MQNSVVTARTAFKEPDNSLEGLAIINSKICVPLQAWQSLVNGIDRDIELPVMEGDRQQGKLLIGTIDKDGFYPVQYEYQQTVKGKRNQNSILSNGSGEIISTETYLIEGKVDGTSGIVLSDASKELTKLIRALLPAIEE